MQFESRLVSEDPPLPDLAEALDAFAPELLDLIEAPQEWADGMTVTGVSVSYDDDDRRGVVVTALRELPATAAPLVINTPHVQEPDPDVDVGDDGAMPEGFLELLASLHTAAAAYVDGEREQAELPLEEAS